MNTQGGTRGVIKGDLKRRLLSSTLATVTLVSEGGSPGTTLISSVLRGLSGVLDVWLGVSAVVIADDGSTASLPASQWPPGAGTVQITPQSNFDDRPKGLFRPVFQDPTFTDNANHPLPQELPFSWNMPGECDEAVIDVELATDAWIGTGLDHVQIQLQVFVEYDGNWWDVTAIELALGQVQLTPVTRPLAMQSTPGGG